MTCVLLLLQLLLPAEALVGGAASLSRRAACHTAASAILCSPALMPLPARAAQRGAEDPYAMQVFDSQVCVKRSPLGACAEFAAPDRSKEKTRYRQLQAEPEEESELISSLRKRSAENADKNAQEVREKTLKAGMGGTFGPFANNAPVMRADGSFDIIPLGRFDRLRDQKKIVQNKNGLDVYAPGFDPDAKEPEKKGFLGLF